MSIHWGCPISLFKRKRETEKKRNFMQIFVNECHIKTNTQNENKNTKNVKYDPTFTCIKNVYRLVSEHLESALTFWIIHELPESVSFPWVLTKSTSPIKQNYFRIQNSHFTKLNKVSGKLRNNLEKWTFQD